MLSDEAPRDPVVIALDLPVDPEVRFHDFFRLIEWENVPEDDPARERLRALFAIGAQGLWPAKDAVWDWSMLGETWRPSAWDDAFVARIGLAAGHVHHPQLRALLLEAMAASGKVDRSERRTVGRRLADAHLEWSRVLCGADEFTGAWIHFHEARKLLHRFGFQAECEAIEVEVVDHALRLLPAGHTAGVGAGNVLGAACDSTRGPLVERDRLGHLLDALLVFADTTPDYIWGINAIDTAEPIHRFLARDARILAELRLARAIREADERALKGDAALAEQVFLQKALQVVVECGLGRERIDALNERLRAAGERALRQLKPVRHEFELGAEMRQSIDDLLALVREVGSTDPKGALCHAAYQNATPLAKISAAHEAHGPSLMDVIQGVSLVGDRMGGELTRERRIKADYVRIFQALPLRVFNSALVEVETVNPDALLTALLGCQAAEGRGDVAIREGVTAFNDERYVVAVYTLLPELEAWVRAIVRRTGRPRTAYRDGRQREHTLDTLVETLRSSLPEADQKIADFLSTMISDEDGFNLRNNALHGLLDPSHIGRGEALIVVQGLLLLAGMQVGTPTPTEPAVPEGA